MPYARTQSKAKMPNTAIGPIGLLVFQIQIQDLAYQAEKLRLDRPAYRVSHSGTTTTWHAFVWAVSSSRG